MEVVKITEKRENEREVVQNNTEITSEQPKEVFVVLPYAGTKGKQIGRKINATMKTTRTVLLHTSVKLQEDLKYIQIFIF